MSQSFMFSNVFVQKKEKTSLLLDIGAGSVTGAFVTYPLGGVPRLVRRVALSYGTDTLPQTHAEKNDVTGHMTHCLDAVLTQLTAETGTASVHADHVSVTFSFPWCAVETKHIHIEQEKKFVITQVFLDDVVRVESDKFIHDLKKSTEETDTAERGEENLGEDFELIEKNILHAEVNGYRVADCLHMSTKIFDFSLQLACVPRDVCDNVTQTVFNHTHLTRERVSLHTFYFLSFASLHMVQPMDYMFLDVCSETTNIFLIQNGCPVKTVSFPSGTHFVIHNVAKSCDVSPEIALSLLHIVFSGKADDETSQKIKSIMEDVEKEWAIYFEDSLVSLSPSGALGATLPTKVFLSAPSQLAPLYAEFLAVSKADATAMFRKSMHVELVTPDLCAPRYHHDPRELFDAHIALAAISL